MTGKKAAAALALAWLASISAPAAEKKSLSIDDIVSMKRLTGLQISGDGSKVAYLATKAENSAERKLLDLGYDEIHVGPGPDQPSRDQKLWVLDLATRRSHPVNTGDLHVLAFEWSPDSARFLLTISDHRFSD